MGKMKMQTANVVAEKTKRIGEMLPNGSTERLNENECPEMAINFDQMFRF